MADITRYTKPTSIWEALETGNLKLLKMSWIIDHAKKGGILAHFQKLPPEAFVSVKELKDQYGDGNPDNVLPIIAISYCWLTPAHPDPEGKQLKTLAAVLESERLKYAEADTEHSFFQGFTEMGVFLDWASAPQKDPELFDPMQTPDKIPEAERAAFLDDLKAKRTFFGGEAYEKSRTEDEKKAFTYVLAQTMDLWYAHQGTTVLKLTKLPEGSTRKVGYEDSGWTTYERRSAEQIKKYYLKYAKWKLVLDLGCEETEQAMRAWPISPDEFDTMIEEKTFTNGSDKTTVKSHFRTMSSAQLGGIKKFDFTGMSHPSVQDARQLSGCLKLCVNLQELRMSWIGLADDVVEVIFTSLPGEALPKLRSLHLMGNRIGNTGAEALVEASKRGALQTLRLLELQKNGIGDAGADSLANAALPALRSLALFENDIGDAGAEAMAQALAGGALPALTSLYMSKSDSALKAACEARQIEYS